MAAVVVVAGDAVAVSAVAVVTLSLVDDVGEATGVLATAVGVMLLVVAVVEMIMLVVAAVGVMGDGAGVPDAVVVPVGVGVVLARMGVAPSWAITMSSSASSQPARGRNVMDEFSLAYERCHSPNGASTTTTV